MGATTEQKECPTGTLIDLNPCNELPKSRRNPHWYLSCYSQDEDGDTQLHLCMVHLPKYKHITQQLIAATWPTSLLDVRNNDGMTALHLGAMGNDSEIVRQLLVAGANPMSRDYYGCIPLHYACREANIDVITALTKAFDDKEIEEKKLKNLSIPDLSATIDMRNNEGKAPIHIATEKGHLNVVEFLLKLGTKIGVMAYGNGHRPLQIAIMKGHKGLTQFLLDYYKLHRNIDDCSYRYCCQSLLKPLQEMGLVKEFMEIFEIPDEVMYPHESSDDD